MIATERRHRAGSASCFAVSAALLGVVAVPRLALAQPYAYVANIGSDDLSIIDLGTASVIKTIAVGSDPDGVAVTPDGARVYVANFLSDSVSVIDTTTNTVAGSIDVGTGPVGVVVTPDGAFAYVANRESNTVSVIETATSSLINTIPVGPGPNAVALTPDGTAAYVTNSFTKSPGTVSVIATATNAVIATVPVYRNPNRLAVTPDGRFAYVTNFRSWNVAVIDTATNTVAATIPLFGRPSGVTINPNGASAYVVTLGGSVAVIETATNALTNVIAVGASPYGIAPTRTGSVAYVANFDSGSVSVVDLVDETEAATIAVGLKPFAVALNCVDGGCTEPAYTPRPTRTPTITPTGSRTPTPTSTRPPTRTPTPTPRPVQILIGTAVGQPGELVNVAVSIDTAGQAVVGAQNDLYFGHDAAVAARANGSPECAVNPEIHKDATSFVFQPVGCQPGVDCEAVRALVFALDNLDPIAPGATLYTCSVRITADAPPGGPFLFATGVSVSDAAGRALFAVGGNGQVFVGQPPFLCSGGGRDGGVCAIGGDCGTGACLSARGVCDGGDDNGRVCCLGGTCATGVLPVCAQERPCVATQRLCIDGTRKGQACVRDAHCPGSRCASTRSYCASGDAFGFACVDDLDCPQGACVTAPDQPTPIPTSTVDPAHAVSLRVGSAVGQPGNRVRVDISLEANGYDVSGVQNDLLFDRRVPIAAQANGRPDCAVNPAIDKGATSFAFQPPGCNVAGDCEQLRALVISIDNSDPIADGSVLYSCMVAIPADAVPGTYALRAIDPVASDPMGNRLDALATDGQVVIEQASSQNARSSQVPGSGSGGGCQLSAARSDAGWLLAPLAVVVWRRRRPRVTAL